MEASGAGDGGPGVSGPGFEDCTLRGGLYPVERTVPCGEDCTLWGALEMLSKGEGLITALGALPQVWCGGLIRVIEEVGEQARGLLS